MKRILLCLLIGVYSSSCDEIQQVVNQLPQQAPLSNEDMISGVRQALEFGVDKQVVKLARENGFYGNDLVKILLPEELSKVDRTLRNIGLGGLADEGLKLMNRAAEDAVKTATPIFIDAIKGLTFEDIKTILLGADDAATHYLKNKTGEPLYSAFLPVVQESFSKVGADRIWASLISKYNDLPLTGNVNPDLNDYVTREALKGVFTMIAVEESEIRNRYESRTTDLLKRVFALQDN